MYLFAVAKKKTLCSDQNSRTEKQSTLIVLQVYRFGQLHLDWQWSSWMAHKVTDQNIFQRNSLHPYIPAQHFLFPTYKGIPSETAVDLGLKTLDHRSFEDP